MGYVVQAHLFHIVDRAVHEAHLDLSTYALTSVKDLFFVTNNHNYARWMAKHQLDLMSLMPTIQPGLKEMLADGLFSIRGDDYQFSRLPVNLTVEHYVNVDAAPRMTGYTAATNRYSASLRWSVTKGSKGAIISTAIEMARIQKRNGDPAELCTSLILHKKSDLRKVMNVIMASADPFNMESDLLI